MTDIHFPIKVFFDSDVIMAGSGSVSGAAHLLPQLAEAGIIEGIISRQVVRECRRNIKDKLPEALAIFDKSNTLALSLVPTLRVGT